MNDEILENQDNKLSKFSKYGSPAKICGLIEDVCYKIISVDDFLSQENECPKVGELISFHVRYDEIILIVGRKYNNKRGDECYNNWCKYFENEETFQKTLNCLKLEIAKDYGKNKIKTIAKQAQNNIETLIKSYGLDLSLSDVFDFCEIKTTKENKMSSLTQHAENELKLAGFFDKDSTYDGMIGKAVMELMEVFAKQGHSGMSAGIVASLFKRVANYEALTPITDNDDEWCEFTSGEFQNKRCGAMFKKDGKVYYLDAIVWRDSEGYSFTTNNITIDGKEYSSSQSVNKFPFTPKTFYVNVIEIPDSNRERFTIVDESELKDAIVYYGEKQ